MSELIKCLRNLQETVEHYENLSSNFNEELVVNAAIDTINYIRGVSNTVLDNSIPTVDTEICKPVQTLIDELLRLNTNIERVDKTKITVAEYLKLLGNFANFKLALADKILEVCANDKTITFIGQRR